MYHFFDTSYFFASMYPERDVGSKAKSMFEEIVENNLGIDNVTIIVSFDPVSCDKSVQYRFPCLCDLLETSHAHEVTY